MNKNKVNQHVEAIRGALVTFLTTLLGDEQSVEVTVSETASVNDAFADAGGRLLIAGRKGEELRGVAVLDRQWLDLLSEAMLGAPMAADDEGAVDLLQEIAAQAYGAVRSQVSSGDDKLPDLAFSVVSGDDIGEVAAQGVTISIKLSSVASPLSGQIVLPVPAPAATAPRAPAPVRMSSSQTGSSVDIAPAAFPDLGGMNLPSGDGSNFGLLAEVELEVTVELGRRRIPLADVLRLTTGSVIELEKLVGEPLEVYANGRLIAEGEAVVIDEQFGVRITNLVSSSKRAKAFI